MKRVLITILIILIVTSFIGTGYFLYQKSVEKPVVYQTESPFITNIVKKTVATGSIVPRKETEVKSQVPGIVEKLYVVPGDKVETGQLLAKIKIVPDAVSVSRAEASVETARINFNNAKQELERQKKLYNQQVISQQAYNRFLLDFKLAEQELAAARENLQVIREGASSKSNNVANLVRATVDGTLLDIPVEEGDVVIQSNNFNDGTTIALIADMSDLIFEGKVDESEVGKLSEGMELLLNVGAIDQERFAAELEFISPKGVEEEGAIQFEIKAAVQQSDDVTLRSGYSANADIVLERKDSVLAIKESTLIFEDDSQFVEVEVSPQEFEKRSVKTGLSDGINIEILNGLQKNEKIKSNLTVEES